MKLLRSSWQRLERLFPWLGSAGSAFSTFAMLCCFGWTGLATFLPVIGLGFLVRSSVALRVIWVALAFTALFFLEEFMILQTWPLIKGYVTGTVAFIACPCHLPLTLPLLIALTAGTAFSTWLENNTTTAVLISTVIFIGGTGLAFKWVSESLSKSETGERKSNKADVELARQVVQARLPGLPKITLLTASNCTSCKSTQTARQQADFDFEEVEITSARPD